MKIPDNDLINARLKSGWDPLTGKSISFLNDQLAYENKDENEEEDEGMDDEAEEVDIILDRFDPEKLVKTCSYINIPEDTELQLNQALKEYEQKYVKRIESLITNVKAGYKGILTNLTVTRSPACFSRLKRFRSIFPEKN